MIWRQGTGDAYALLAALASESGISPLPELARTGRGKPYFPSRPDVRFSLSHSRTLCLCALGEAEVGADIEVIHPRRPGLPAYALDERELDWFRRRGERWEDFYALWTMKEARVKCTGEGLIVPPREIAVPLLEAGERGEFEGFVFHALTGEGWRGAICTEKKEKIH